MTLDILDWCYYMRDDAHLGDTGVLERLEILYQEVSLFFPYLVIEKTIGKRYSAPHLGCMVAGCFSRYSEENESETVFAPFANCIDEDLK